MNPRINKPARPSRPDRFLYWLIPFSLTACLATPQTSSPTSIPLSPTRASVFASPSVIFPTPLPRPPSPPPLTATNIPAPPLPTPTLAPLPFLTLDEKLGLLILSGLNGTETNRETQSLITHYHLGGFVLRGRNIRDYPQTQLLIANLQSLAASPLFIATDQEGGDVTRLTDGLTHFPSAMALGATGDPDLAYRVGYATAAELLSLGVNVNLAPDLDVLTNPANTLIGLRSFGSDPALVGQLGAEFMRGTLAAGAIPALKHYPGHGSVATDSHAGLPAVDRLDIEPFNSAIAVGAPVVMLGHLWVRHLDPAPLPASLSPRLIERLRQNFDGVLLTDSLNMGAITNQHTVPQAALLAFQAGADWLLVAEPADVPSVIQTLRAALQRGDISIERLDASVNRLLTLKTRLARTPALAPDLASDASLALDVSRRALTVTCSPNTLCVPVIPSDTKKILLLAPNLLPSAIADPDHVTYLAQLLAARGYRVTELLYHPDTGLPADYPQQAELYAKANDLILFGAWDAHLDPSALQSQTFRRLQATHKPLIIIGLHLPYDLQVLPADIYLATFGDTRAQMEAIVGALMGEFEPKGQMPVVPRP